MEEKTRFAPQLFIPDGVTDIRFYEIAFGAVEQRRWTNDDGTIHVAEFTIGEALFHLHQQNPEKGQFDPRQCRGVTATIGIFVPDVHAVMKKAEAAGAAILSPAKDYEYGYRQGEVKDVFGHRWLIQQRIED